MRSEGFLLLSGGLGPGPCLPRFQHRVRAVSAAWFHGWGGRRMGGAARHFKSCWVVSGRDIIGPQNDARRRASLTRQQPATLVNRRRLLSTTHFWSMTLVNERT